VPGPEISLRPLVHGDAPVLASWADDATFRAHAGWRQHPSTALAVTWWQHHIAEPDPRLVRLLALHGEEAVGYVDLYADDESARELGYLIAPSARWGRGLGTAVARAGLAHGFEVLGLERIWAEAVEANVASVRVLRRIGMRATGFGATDEFLGESSRYLQFELLRTEWRQLT